MQQRRLDRPLRPLAALVALALAGPAAAGEVRVEGSWRLRYANNTDLTLDDDATRLGQHSWLEHRIRLSPKVVEEGQWEVQASLDVLAGVVAGDLARDFAGLGWDGRSERKGTSARGFEFRHLFATARLPFGQLMLGQMPSQWGLGLVANGGNDDDAADWGDARFGDIVDRVLFATRPLQAFFPQSDVARQITSAIGFDMVFKDRFAQLVVSDTNGTRWGDLAFQGAAAAWWEPGEGRRVGAYVARRWQEFAGNTGNLHLWLFDLHARGALALPALDATLSVEGEAAVVNGGTSHATNLNALVSSKVLQSGGAVRARLALPQAIEAELEAGFASGDQNPFDDQAAAFQMNRDYKVSLVLWDEVLLFQSQNAARRLADPNLVGRPPNGVDLIPTQGAVTNAIYLKPTVRWRPPQLHGKVRLTASLLWAVAPEPYVDAYQSLLASAPRNPFGAAAGKGYGVEADLGVCWREKFGRLGTELGAQWGVLLPGDAFDLPDGSRMGKVAVFKARAGISF